MRLLVISHACLTGINRKVFAKIADQGIEVKIVIPPEWNGIKAQPATDDDPPLIHLPLKGLNPRTYQFEGIINLLSTYRPQAIYLDADPLSITAVKIGRWTKRNNSKLLCLSTDNLDFSVSAHIKRFGLRGLAPALAKNMLHFLSRPNVDCVFTLSDAGTQIFTKRNYKNVVKTPLGFDPKNFYPDAKESQKAREALGIAKDAFVFSYFGRLAELKGVHLICEVLGEISRDKKIKQPWVFLVDKFLGQSPYRLQVEAAIRKHGLSNKVLFINPDHKTIAAPMRATDVVLLFSLSTPNLVEQYGRVIPEAMACGALAVVSDSGTPKELVGETGCVVAQGNKEQLRRTLTRILQNPDHYSKQREAGTFRALEHLSIDRQAELICEVLS